MAPSRILILGGGAAGWLSAAYLARSLPDAAITLVESPAIATVGVGEGSFPSLRNTLSFIGLDERAFLRDADAAFKQGVVFDGWKAAGTSYFHPFNAPHRAGPVDLAPYWLLRRAAGAATPFADAVTLQGEVVRQGRAPKRLSDPDFAGPMNYAYHFDAAKLAAALAARARTLGVRHLQGEADGVTLAPDGRIAGVHVAGHGDLSADLYLDCTGFRARLIGEALGARFRPAGDSLFNDRAVALQLPYDRPDAPIVPATVATAHAAGWTWDIGLPSRRGVGYVYSSAHCDDDRAEATLRAYAGPAADGLSARRLRFDTGYRETPWIGNCVAVGLAAGFFEPLESTGVMLIEIAAAMIADLFTPDPDGMAAAARRYNAMMSERHARIIDFLKLHYALSRRPEPYWRDNADPRSWSETLRDHLAQWARRPVSRFDFAVDHETFLPPSYQFILYGMDAPVETQALAARHPHAAAAERAFDEVRRGAPEALRHLPGHRDLLTALTAGTRAA